MGKRVVVAVAWIVVAWCAGAPHAAAQRTTAGIRGQVLDEAGQPIPGVQIEMEFKGESRRKITRTQQSDKSGGFVRMGIPDGMWQITFSRPGYQTYVMEIHLSLGGFSEAGEVVLKAAPAMAAAKAASAADVPAPAAPGTGLPAGEVAALEQSYAAALDAARAGRYDEAEAGLKAVLSKFPEVASAHYNLGYVYRMKQDWKAAEAEYLRVTELEPSKSDAFIALAAVREADGRADEAAEALLAAAPAFAGDARFQYALGVTSINSGRSADAEAALRKALELDPANADAHYQLGTVLVGQGKIKEAIAELETYLGMAPADAANLPVAKGLLAALKK
jgi:tetratricopeptide (TPR) repeat protein